MITWVLPSIDRAWRRACIDRMAPEIRARLVVVDNGRANRGVAASWNVGIDVMRALGHEWIVLLSEAVRFGAAAGQDWEEVLTEDEGSAFIDGLFAWHLIAFRASTIARVGYFDEAFWPAYGEDSDYLYRLHLAGMASPRENDRPGRRQVTGIDATDLGYAHGVKDGLVFVDFGGVADRYRSKWGGDQGHETYTTPYGNPDLTWADITRRDH